MVRVNAPLFSFSAHGWLGRYTYARTGVVKNPYPIDLFAFRYGVIQHSGIWSDKKIAWDASNFTWDGQRADMPRAFLSFYYSPKGWCYQRRRTWHGIIYSAMRPPISAQPKTASQEAWKSVFADAVAGWQALTGIEKGVWNSYNYPKHPSGYNRFLRWYLKSHYPPPAPASAEWSDTNVDWSDSVWGWST